MMLFKVRNRRIISVTQMGFLLGALMLVTTTSSGCNYAILAGYLIGGPPSIEPDFELMTKKSMTDKDVVVAVVCYAPTELKWDFSKVDKEIAKYVAFKMVEHNIRVINPDRVSDWLDRHNDWDTPDEVGEALGATFVVYIDLSNFSLYEENSQNLYRGRAEALVSVVEMEEGGGGEKIYNKEIISRFPLAVPRSTMRRQTGRCWPRHQ